MNRVPPLVSVALISSAFAALLILENRRPLRGATESKLRRLLRNIGIGGVGAATMMLAEWPLIFPLAALCQQRRWGIFLHFALPGWIAAIGAILLMDYTLYVWHVLTHKVPLLWRFHQPHHVDLDLDASTGIRFHFGELLLSIGWRSAQIVVIGVTPLALSLWSTLTIIEVLFHHSNVQLPLRVERWLNLIVVTPRMHGIHHSIVRDEMNSNWSSGLTIWDRLHRTLRLDIPQRKITIGVAAFLDPRRVTFLKVLWMSFRRRQPDPWRLPSGEEAHRAPVELSKPRTAMID